MLGGPFACLDVGRVEWVGERSGDALMLVPAVDHRISSRRGSIMVAIRRVFSVAAVVLAAAVVCVSHAAGSDRDRLAVMGLRVGQSRAEVAEVARHSGWK